MHKFFKPMNRLTRSYLKQNGTPAGKATCGPLTTFPEKIVQFGEGNFLRAFVDWKVDELNAQGHFGGSVLVAQPIRQGMAAELQKQDCLYTVILRGIEGGAVVESRRIVTALSRAINPYDQWAELVKAFRGTDLRFVVSNTTEAGIAYVEEAHKPGVCPDSFPAKVANLLAERFESFKGDVKKGLVFLPCELIDRNGENLRKTVLQHAHAWKLSADFITWIETANYFCNTLVDRIVPGYPKDEAVRIGSELGYEDNLLVAAEYFHVWVIEGPKHLADEIPFHKAGLNVIWTDDMTPYRTRKVRLLNGAHTSSVLAAFEAGCNTVREMVEDPICGAFIRKAVFDEILYQVPLPPMERKAYADSVLERFGNPFIRHELLSISLNSASKWKVRVLPSLLDCQKHFGKLPPALSFSLAALIWFYAGEPVSANELRGRRNRQAYPIKDDAPVLAFFAETWKKAADLKPESLRELAFATLGRKDFWGQDLNEIPGFTELVTSGLQKIATRGMRATLAEIVATSY
jgi:tagaturonate reductase